MAPVSTRQLKRLATDGQLRPVDLVWKEGLRRWLAASSVRGLFSVPRDLPGSSSGPPSARPEVVPARTTQGRTNGVLDPEVREICSHLTEYARAIPHHDLEDLGSQVEVTRVTHVPVYQVIVQSLCEERKLLRKQRAYRGGPISPLRVTEAGVNVWQFALPQQNEFRDSQTERAVKGSQSIHSCPGCQGLGVAECIVCAGSVLVVCPSCLDVPATRCRACSGSGRVKKTRWIGQREERCYCRGGILGNDVCYRCNGRGAFKEDVVQEYSVSCSSCSGRGLLRCECCGGQGTVTCSSCDGSCQVTCGGCEGFKKVVGYLSLLQSFESSQLSTQVDDAELPLLATLELNDALDYETILDQSEQEFSPGFPLAAPLDELRQDVDALIGKSRAVLRPSQRIVEQALSVRQAEVIQARYRHRGRDYELWLVGQARKLVAPRNPITESAADLVKDALELWAAGRRGGAESRLRQVLEMGQADPHCQAIYDEPEQGPVASTDTRMLKPKKRLIPRRTFIRPVARNFKVGFDHLASQELVSGSVSQPAKGTCWRPWNRETRPLRKSSSRPAGCPGHDQLTAPRSVVKKR